LPATADHVLAKAREEGQEGDKDFGKRFHDVVAALAKAFKLAAGRNSSPDFAIEQLLNRAVASNHLIFRLTRSNLSSSKLRRWRA